MVCEWHDTTIIIIKFDTDDMSLTDGQGVGVGERKRIVLLPCRQMPQVFTEFFKTALCS
jgi:hypothetical protein